MPNFVAFYALDAALRYIDQISLAAIQSQADPLVAHCDTGLRELGLEPLCPWSPSNPSGILAFKHARSPDLHTALERSNIHVMHHAGRIRIAIHGYNTAEDIGTLLRQLQAVV
jgi:cysteine desulfurase / selenocysteine lyase